MLEESKSATRRVQEEENVKRQNIQRSMYVRLQECEVFLYNEVTDNGDLVYFSLIFESEPLNSKEALSDPKWICALK